MFGLDCQLQYLDSPSVWAEPSATVHGFPECLLNRQLRYLDSQSVWAGLSATVPGFPECLGWTVSYSTWFPRVFGLDCQLQYLDSQRVFGLDC